jgi:hypothetical protein
MQDADLGTDKFCANITLTRRPSAKELKLDTKADKNLDRTLRKQKSKFENVSDHSDGVQSRQPGTKISKKQTSTTGVNSNLSGKTKSKAAVAAQLDVEITPERVLFRMTLDYRSLNRKTTNDVTITLPTLQSIEQKFRK